jgi:hypothetical protein
VDVEETDRLLLGRSPLPFVDESSHGDTPPWDEALPLERAEAVIEEF